MEALRAVETELEKVFSQIENVNDKFMDSVTYLINFISNIKKRIDEKVKVNEEYELTEAEVKSLKGLTQMVYSTLEQTSTNHRAVHANVCRLGRTIDKNLDSELEEITRDVIPSAGDADRREKLNQAVCEHLYREGMSDVGISLQHEGQIKLREGFAEPLTQQRQILDSLKQYDLGPAIDWVFANRDALVKNGSKLEYDLHKMAFLLLVEADVKYQEEAVKYARENLSPFISKYESEIKSLMGALIYAGDVHRSPYANLFDQIHWANICELFLKDSCKILEIPLQCTLSVCVTTGCSAIRTRSNVRKIIKDRQAEHYWNVSNGLPIDTRLGDDFQYHSIFSCPILRQQSTENNPPCRLPCGHVISHEALIKLVLTNPNNAKKASGGKEKFVKCPYCPVQERANLSRAIKF